MGRIGSISDFDLSKQIIRHPHQITSVGSLVAGKRYAYVHACSQRGYMVSDYVFFGIFFAGEGKNIAIAQIRCLKRVKDDTLGFTLHSDGWVEHFHLGGPSHVQWQGTRLCSYSNYGFNYGLSDIKPTPQDANIQHHIVVPRADWLRDPKMLCDYEGDQGQVQAKLSFAPQEIDIDTRHKQGRDNLLNSVFGS